MIFIHLRNFSHYYYLKGLYCLESHSDSAKYWFTKCQEFAKTNNNKSFSAYAWYLYYIKHQQMDSVAKYSEQAFAYNDSANLDMERDLMQKMQAIYDYDRWKNVAHNEEIKATRANLTLLVSILVSVSVIIIGILTFLVYRKKRKLELQEKEEQENLIRQQIYYTKQELVSEKEKIEFLKRENSSYSDKMAEKEEKILSLQQELDALSANITNSEPKKNVVCSKKAIVLVFKGMANHGKVPTEEQWKVLAKSLNDLSPTFLNVLNDKKLTENEYRVCMLVWLLFCPRELAILMNLSSSNISNIRKRMAYKIFGEDMSATKFDKRIREIQ